MKNGANQNAPDPSPDESDLCRGERERNSGVAQPSANLNSAAGFAGTEIRGRVADPQKQAREDPCQAIRVYVKLRDVN